MTCAREGCKKDVPKIVGQMLEHDGPVVVDFVVEPNEHVYPMVPAGKGLHEQIGRASCRERVLPTV